MAPHDPPTTRHPVAAAAVRAVRLGTGVAVTERRLLLGRLGYWEAKAAFEATKARCAAAKAELRAANKAYGEALLVCSRIVDEVEDLDAAQKAESAATG